MYHLSIYHTNAMTICYIHFKYETRLYFRAVKYTACDSARGKSTYTSRVFQAALSLTGLLHQCPSIQTSRVNRKLICYPSTHYSACCHSNIILLHVTTQLYGDKLKTKYHFKEQLPHQLSVNDLLNNTAQFFDSRKSLC